MSTRSSRSEDEGSSYRLSSPVKIHLNESFYSGGGTMRVFILWDSFETGDLSCWGIQVP